MAKPKKLPKWQRNDPLERKARVVDYPVCSYPLSYSYMQWEQSKSLHCPNCHKGSVHLSDIAFDGGPRREDDRRKEPFEV